MRRVAQAVGITPMAVYRHYADREGLLNALADEGFRGIGGSQLATQRIFRQPRESASSRILDIYLEHALQNPRLFELMFLKPRPGARRYPHDFKAGASPTANLITELIQEGMQSGHFRKDDPWEITFEMGALLAGPHHALSRRAHGAVTRPLSRPLPSVAPSGDISMAFATDYRRILAALLVIACTSTLVYFGNGLNPLWPLLWFAPSARARSSLRATRGGPLRSPHSPPG